MTGRAFNRSGFVEQHFGVIYQFDSAMAARAAHVFVDTLQRKLRAGVVIEQRRFPLDRVVAGGALRRFAIDGELRAVGVFVALLAKFRRDTKIHVDQGCFQVGGAMAIGAGDGPMRSDQGVLGRGMIELR